MEVLFTIVIYVVFGVICALIAQSKGRSGIGWFFIGFFAACIGIIIILVLPNLKEEQAKHQQLQRENRRLREKVRKERQTADRRHAQTQQRLGVHDQALDVDTSRQLESKAGQEFLATSGKPPSPPESRPPPKRNTPEEKVWFYEDQGSLEQGPVSGRQLALLLKNNEINLTTPVWRDPWPQWRALGEVEGELNNE